jgi:argininosuccinate lyase
MTAMKKPWGGRFEKDTNEMVEQFSESVSFDSRLYREDIRASIAHAEMLARSGLVSDAELVEIREGLGDIQKEIESGAFDWKVPLEDVHMNIEAALIARIGDAGRKLHTARSRNDQVACDLRLWCRAAADELDELLAECQRALLEAAQECRAVIVPGFTHLQHAQPVLLAHTLLAYVEMLHRDRARLADCRRRLNVSPLGACALAGTALPIDPQSTAEELEFDGCFDNSMDAVSDRDFVLELAFDLCMIALHLSRLAEEWLIWSAPEFDFVDLDEAFCTGSSIMPQKKNADVLELLRGRCGRVYGDLMALLTTMKGLPLAYNPGLLRGPHGRHRPGRLPGRPRAAVQGGARDSRQGREGGGGRRSAAGGAEPRTASLLQRAGGRRRLPRAGRPQLRGELPVPWLLLACGSRPPAQDLEAAALLLRREPRARPSSAGARHSAATPGTQARMLHEEGEADEAEMSLRP